MIFEIKNRFLTVKINDFGAELSSIKRNNDDYEYLWQGDSAYWGRRAPILFPIVGKLKDNTYTYMSQEYEMTQHGFARDMTFDLFDAREDYIAFLLKSTDETRKKYPFDFELVLSYALEEDALVVGYHVKSMDEKVMPFSIGAHPAFNWEQGEETYFEFATGLVETFLLTDDGIDLNKVPVAIANGKLTINQELFKNDALIIEDLNEVAYVNGNRSVTMHFDGFPYTGLWSKPSGAPFICIEPWFGMADVIGHDQDIMQKKGMLMLEPQMTFTSEYMIKIS